MSASRTPFSKYAGEAEGWAEGSLDADYCAFDPDLLATNDSLFNELLLAAHAIKISCAAGEDGDEGGDADDVDALAAVQSDLASFIDTAADAFALDRPCLVCRVLDVYRREYGLSALWMADYAFLCAKCLASPPCATVTFIAAFEFAYVMDKHYLERHGATLVGSYARRVLTYEDIQRHFFLHGCFRTDGGVPGRKQDDVVVSRPRPGRPAGGRTGPTSLGTAKVLYSNYSFLAQSATRAMMSTLADGPSDGSAMGAGPEGGEQAPHHHQQQYAAQAASSAAGGGRRARRASSLEASKAPPGGGQVREHTRPPGACGPAPSCRGCPTPLAVALAGWKECARSVECSPAPGRRGDSCALRASRADDDYEAEMTREASDCESPREADVTPAYAALFPPAPPPRAYYEEEDDEAGGDAASYEGEGDDERPETRGGEEEEDGALSASGDAANAWAYADLALLLLAGTGAAPVDATREFTSTAATVRKETVEAYWSDNRRGLLRDVAPRYARFYGEDAEPDLDLGPVMITPLKHARVRGGTSAECAICNMLLVKDYWLALRRLKRDIIAYSANNVGLFHSVCPALDEWAEENRLGADDGRRFVNLLKSAGHEAVYKHFFCDPMCAVRTAQTNPRVLFEHPRRFEGDELALYKARLASGNRFEGRVCAGLWALAYAFKTYQVFPPKPTALAAFVKDAGSLLQRHSIALVSLEHTIWNYV
uniref:Packaging protein UL32 n=1 Tax=Anatid alphaherpesvirus 2 TaxID=3080522 RepID=A0AAU0K6H1_9ALPH